MESRPIREMRANIKALFSRRKSYFEQGRHSEATQQYLDNELFLECKCASQEDAKRVRELLRKGANPNAALNHDRVSNLAHAAENEFCEIAKLLLKAGADVNAMDREGMTPLMHATKYVNEAATAKVLLEYGADANAKDNEGMTPLMHAALKGGPELVNLLLKNGAFITVADFKGRTVETHLQERHRKAILPLGGNALDKEVYDGIIKAFNGHRARALKRITGLAFGRFRSNFRECLNNTF
jgi:ankyrin repeat protein